MSVIAFIPARGGSKGIPKKNIKLLHGKPLIAWTIENAVNSKSIDKVIVSTDCEEIAKIAKEYGAEVPFIRPESISGDTATTESAMLHCLSYLESIGDKPELFILLQATSPLRKEYELDSAISFLRKHDYDSVLSVSESHRFFWKNKSNAEASYDYKSRPRRQDISENDRNYLETGAFYITKYNNLKFNENRLSGRIGLFVTDEIQSYEIDTETDFIICEKLMESFRK